MVTKDEIVLVKNVGGVDGPPTFEDVTTNSSHMGNVHLKLGNSLKNGITIYNYTSSNCTLETTPLCFNFLGFYFL